MSAKSLQELNLEFETALIDQRFGPLLDNTIKEQIFEDWTEFDRIGTKFRKSRSRYLNSLVLTKIIYFPLFLMFLGSLLKIIDEREISWGFAFIPAMIVGLFCYRHWCGSDVIAKQKSFASAVAEYDDEKDLQKIEVIVDWGESATLKEVAEHSLDNAVRAISMTKKAIRLRKRSSLLLGISYGLIMGLVFAGIGFFLTNVLEFSDPMFVSFLDFASYLFFIVGLGLAALPYTDHNNLLSQLSGLVQDYCHYRDLCSRFDLIDTAEFDRRFVAEIAEPNLFSSIPPSLVVYKTSQWR